MTALARRGVGGIGSKLALAAASVVAVLALAECGMRVAGVGEVMTFRADPRFGYLMRPSQRISTYGNPIEINSLGLRGPEPLDPKPREVTRILFLGDSITYGGGRIPESELFCRRVETLAAQRGFRVESVNVSAPGWGPRNWAAWVAANGTVAADIVVPVIPATDLARPFALRKQQELLERQPLLRLSIFWFRLESSLRLRLESLRSSPDPALSDELLAANLRAARELLERLGATPRLAVFVPSRDKADDPPERWAPFQALFPDAVDLRAELEPSDYLDEVHLASSGHRAIAERIYPQLEPLLGESAGRGAPRVP